MPRKPKLVGLQRRREPKRLPPNKQPPARFIPFKTFHHSDAVRIADAAKVPLDPAGLELELDNIAMHFHILRDDAVVPDATHQAKEFRKIVFHGAKLVKALGVDLALPASGKKYASIDEWLVRNRLLLSRLLPTGPDHQMHPPQYLLRTLDQAMTAIATWNSPRMPSHDMPWPIAAPQTIGLLVASALFALADLPKGQREKHAFEQKFASMGPGWHRIDSYSQGGPKAKPESSWHVLTELLIDLFERRSYGRPAAHGQGPTFRFVQASIRHIVANVPPSLRKRENLAKNAPTEGSALEQLVRKAINAHRKRANAHLVPRT